MTIETHASLLGPSPRIVQQNVMSDGARELRAVASDDERNTPYDPEETRVLYAALDSFR